MLNYIWLALILAAVLLGGAHGSFKEVTDAAFDSAKTAVMNIALPLAGIMALWLGIMRLAERSGLVQVLARGLRPILRRLFPDVPADHPAMGAMVMNIAANMLGLGNSATALGLRAMQRLERLNPHPGTATNAMCTFLAINTSSVQLIPVTAIGILAASGSANPTVIIGPALAATSCAAAAAIIAVKMLERLPMFAAPPAQTGNGEPVETAPPDEEEASPAPIPLRWWGFLLLAALAMCFAWWFARDAFLAHAPANPASSSWSQAVTAASNLAVPFFLSFFPLYAFCRGVKVYEEFVEGAKEGFQVAVRIIPYLVAILVAVGLFRAAGGIDMLAHWLQPILGRIGFPVDLLPIALVRPLSGGATIGLFGELVKAHGPDSFVARTAGVILGSTETTFYVLAVYFGSVGIRRTRHAVLAGLAADITGVVASFIICKALFS
ncbi:MAG TPA: nucleoside recognition domain-containing protein [Chthoniobacteraceae bacterium]|jgi:spore maturation protein SpmA|nr:nucleoside recognition domain-containing protein [Chthoniobacteraceae bacterium]